MPEFDWYQATIPKPLDDVLEALCDLDEGLRVSHTRGHHGYAHTAVLGSALRGDVARVMHGGSHEHPHATVSGEWAPHGAQLIRARFPQHTVSRVDVREDFGGEGAYDAMQPQLLDIAARLRIQVDCKGDHLVTKKGRTLYLGSTKSPVRLRLYDKAAEMRSHLAVPKNACPIEWGKAHGIPEHLARLEAQIRPHTREAKAEFAAIEPTRALGASPWMREAWKQIAGLDLDAVQVARGYRPADDERARTFMLKQYGSLLSRWLHESGSPECLGLNIAHELAEARKREIRGH